MSNIPAFDDPILIRLTHEDVRIIETHACPDDEFLAALKNANKSEDGVMLACRRECLINVNCVLYAVSEELDDKEELNKLVTTFETIEPYEW